MPYCPWLQYPTGAPNLAELMICRDLQFLPDDGTLPLSISDASGHHHPQHTYAEERLRRCRVLDIRAFPLSEQGDIRGLGNPTLGCDTLRGVGVTSLLYFPLQAFFLAAGPRAVGFATAWARPAFAVFGIGIESMPASGMAKSLA